MKKGNLHTTITLTVTLCFLLISGSISHASTSNNVTVILDGETLDFDVPAQIIDGRTMVPMRLIFEKLGAEVFWDETSQGITAQSSSITLQMYIGSHDIVANTVSDYIYTVPQIINNRTFVPARTVSELLGALVEWDDSTKTVYITSPPKNPHNWDDEHYFYGTMIDGKAEGYGIQYRKSDNTISQIGKFKDGYISHGTTYYSNGDIFIGTYDEYGPISGTKYFTNGDYYAGGIPNHVHSATGTYWYANGDTLTGDFDVYGGCINGTYYISEVDIYCRGNFNNSKPNGIINFYDSAMNYLFSAEYENGELILR